MALPSNYRPWRRPPGTRPLVLGHRGSRTRAPENTLAAFELARTEGADGVELDVRLDGSGEVIVLHDRSLGRVTGSREERDVETLSSRELGRCEVGQGERVPRLLEVLAWATAHGQLVDIELKADVGDPRRLVARVAALVGRRRKREPPVLLSSFHAGMVLDLGRRLEQVPVAWLVRRRSWLRGSATFCRSLGAAGIHPARDLVEPALVRSWRAHGLLVGVWTVNHPEEALSLGQAGVDALITDDPAAIVRALRAAHWQSA